VWPIQAVQQRPFAAVHEFARRLSRNIGVIEVTLLATGSGSSWLLLKFDGLHRMLIGYVLLLASLGFALDLSIAAMIILPS
jgi:putative copper export protein